MANRNHPRLLHFEHLQEEIGAFGLYQILMSLTTQLAYVCVTGSMLCTMFDNIPPIKSECRNATTKLLNSSSILSQSQRTIINGSTLYRNQSSNIDHNHFNSKHDPTIIYDFYSLYIQLRLECSHDYIPTILVTAVMAGGVIGASIFGILADRFGRKPMCILSLSGLIISNFLIVSVFSWISATVLLTFIGIFGGGYMVVNLVLMLEVVGSNWRLFCTCLNGWPLGLMTMALIGYISQDWRYYHVSLGIVGAPCLIALFFMSESPRWLIQHDRFAEAKKIVHSIASMNGRPVPDFSAIFNRNLSEQSDNIDGTIEADRLFISEVIGNNNTLNRDDESDMELEEFHTVSDQLQPLSTLNHSDNHEQMQNSDLNNTRTLPVVRIRRSKHKPKHYSYIDLVRSRTILIPLLALFYSWFASSVISFGIYFNLGTLAGDRYLNTFLLGLFKGASGVIPLILSHWLGRRPILISSVLVACLSCWAALLVYYIDSNNFKSLNGSVPINNGSFNYSLIDSVTKSYTKVQGSYSISQTTHIALTVFAVIGASAIDPIWKVNHLYSTELFPTVVRNMARAVCNVGSRFGGVLAPQVAYLQTFLFPLPFIIFGILSLIHVFVCVFLLPETKGKPLPDQLISFDNNETQRTLIGNCQNESRDNNNLHYNNCVTTASGNQSSLDVEMNGHAKSPPVSIHSADR